MPELERELAELVAIPSVSATDYPEETHAALLEACGFVQELLRGAGVEQVGTLELPHTAPIVVGEIPAPPGAPTVLLYSHYDVVPAGDEELWDSPPFEATKRDGAIFGRGAADTKSNILAHVGALRAWEGRPPVGIKIVIEGQEEVGSVLNTYPATDPEPFRADAMLIGDMGSIRPGVPTLTIGLRGHGDGDDGGLHARRGQAQRPVRRRRARRDDRPAPRACHAPRRERRRRRRGPAARAVARRRPLRGGVPPARRGRGRPAR